MRIVVDTSTIIAVVVGEAEKARLIELTKDATQEGVQVLEV